MFQCKVAWIPTRCTDATFCSVQYSNLVLEFVTYGFPKLIWKPRLIWVNMCLNVPHIDNISEASLNSAHPMSTITWTLREMAAQNLLSSNIMSSSPNSKLQKLKKLGKLIFLSYWATCVQDSCYRDRGLQLYPSQVLYKCTIIRRPSRDWLPISLWKQVYNGLSYR